MATEDIIWKEDIIREICNSYGCSSPENIETFASVFYPIANIELEMQEKTFEDFDPVQLAVLKLMNIGYTQQETIAKLLSLNAIYVGKIQKLLFGYAFIDAEYKVTDLGRESISKGKKVQLVNSRQVFQLDAINLSLIRLDRTIREESLRDKDRLYDRILILDYPDAINSDVIISNLSQNDFRAVMAQKRGVLNTNVVHINSVRSLNVSYVKSYMIKLKDSESLLLFYKREKSTWKKNKEKTNWFPFSVPDAETAAKFGLDSFIISSKESVQMLKERFEMLNGYADTLKVKELIENSIAPWLKGHGINSDKTRYEKSDRTVYLTDRFAFEVISQNTVKDLYFLSKDGIIVSTDDNFAGRIVKLKIKDKELKLAASKLQEMVDQAVRNTGDVFTVFTEITGRLEKFQDEGEVTNIVEKIEKLYADVS